MVGFGFFLYTGLQLSFFTFLVFTLCFFVLFFSFDSSLLSLFMQIFLIHTPVF